MYTYTTASYVGLHVSLYNSQLCRSVCKQTRPRSLCEKVEVVAVFLAGFLLHGDLIPMVTYLTELQPAKPFVVNLCHPACKHKNIW